MAKSKKSKGLPWHWVTKKMDKTTIQQICKTGYLGTLWGADFHVSDGIQGYAGGGEEPIKAPSALFTVHELFHDESVPAQESLGFLGYEQLGQIIHSGRRWGKSQALAIPISKGIDYNGIARRMVEVEKIK